MMMEMIVMMLNDSVVDSKDCCSFLFKQHCAREKMHLRIRFKPSLFQHVGKESSLKGKKQTLIVSENQFLKIVLALYTHTHMQTHNCLITSFDITDKNLLSSFFPLAIIFVKVLMIFALMNEYSGETQGAQAPTFLGQTELHRTGKKTFLRLSSPIVL